jgi:hypothetical protein
MRSDEPFDLPEPEHESRADQKRKRPPIPDGWLMSCYITMFMGALMLILPRMWPFSFLLAGYSFVAGLVLAGTYRIPRTLMWCVFAAGALLFWACVESMEADYEASRDRQ